MRTIQRRLFLAAVAGGGLAAQTPAPKWQGTWSASGGRGVLRGGWTASPGDGPGVLVGTWTLRDAGNRVQGGGTWSASKSDEGWAGFWRAVPLGRDKRPGPEIKGSWKAEPALAASAGMAELIGLAMKNIVSGEWFMGKNSGAWSIRVQQDQ